MLKTIIPPRRKSRNVAAILSSFTATIDELIALKDAKTTESADLAAESGRLGALSYEAQKESQRADLVARKIAALIEG